MTSLEKIVLLAKKQTQLIILIRRCSLIHISFLFFLLILYEFLIVDSISTFYGAENHTLSFADYSPFELFIILCLAPAIEEFAFRTYLSRKRSQSWTLVLTIMFINTVYFDKILFIVLSILSFGILIILQYDEVYNYIFKRHYNLLFVTSALIFSAMHIDSFDVEHFYAKLILIFLIVPAGLYFGLVRVKYGLVASIFSHAIYNFFILFFNFVLYKY